MSRREPLSVSAILPCYEEAPNLRRVVSELTRALGAGAIEDWEIVLVTTRACSDGTVELAAELCSEDSRIRSVEQPVADPGYGRAVALGIGAARMAWLFLSDADGQFDHSELGLFLERACEADVIIGYRRDRSDSLPRRVAGKLYNQTIKRAAGIGAVRDVDCAFKLIQRSLLAGPPFTSRTGAVNAEILRRALAGGGRLAQLPVTHRTRAGGRSRFETERGAFPAPREMLSILRDVAALARRRFV